MKILGTISTINEGDLLDPDDIFIIRDAVGVEADHSVLILPGEEDGFYVSGGKLYNVSSCRGDFEVCNYELHEFYQRNIEIFEDMCKDAGIDTSSLDFISSVLTAELPWFGCSDFPRAYRVDAGYQRIKAVQFTEPALIIGSTMSDEECGFGNYVKCGFYQPAVDFFDIGITESGKWFAVKQGEILYFNTLEFQKFLEEEINLKGK